MEKQPAHSHGANREAGLGSAEAVGCHSCAPRAWTHCTHAGLHQNTHTHTHKDIHAEECMAMSRSATFSAFPLTLRGCLEAGRLWAEWGEAVRGSLSPQATPPQSHQVSRFELAFKAHISPSPRSLPAIGTISPTPAFTTKSPLSLLQWNCLQA